MDGQGGNGGPEGRRVRVWLDAIAAAAEPEITAATHHLALTLAHHLQRGQDHPGLLAVAQQMRSKPQTVSKHVRVLERLGYLEVRRGGDRRIPTHYRLLLPAERPPPGRR